MNFCALLIGSEKQRQIIWSWELKLINLVIPNASVERNIEKKGISKSEIQKNKQKHSPKTENNCFTVYLFE